MAAGTAAALVPIRSITRNSDSKTTEYIPSSSEDPGAICSKLLATLKGIQSGKIQDTFGWNKVVEKLDINDFTTTEKDGDNGLNGNVDKLP